MFDEMDQVDDWDLQANQLYKDLRASASHLGRQASARIILYLVAVRRLELMGRSPHIRRTPEAFAMRMAKLMKRCGVNEYFREQFTSPRNLTVIARLLEVLKVLDTRLEGGSEFSLRLFDIILRHTFSQVFHLNLYHPHIVASLAVSLCRNDSGIIETFPYSGAASITADAMGKPLEVSFWHSYGYPYEHQDLVELRLIMRNLSQTVFGPNRLDEDAGSFLTLIDGAQKPKKKQRATLATLTKLIERHALSETTLVILDPVDCQGIPEALRQQIARDDLLEAVIDLVSFDSEGKRNVFTAWLLNRNKQSGNRNETLFMDATQLVDHGYFEAAWFAAALIQRWRSPMGKIGRLRYKQVLDSKLKGLFLKYFTNDYRDLPGLCKVRLSDEAIRADCLTASDYLGEEHGRASVVSVNNEVLLSRLLTEDNPSCSYIIGNNGAGKSLLLRGLVDELSWKNLNTVGIAFSPLDRFPTEPGAYPLFEYQGASNSLFSPDRGAFLQELSEQLVEIYSGGPTLQTFTRVLEQINFSHRHYLYPQIDPDDDRDEFERRLATIELQEDPEPFVLEDRYEPGLKREERGPIVRFSVLSSGEQQILSLLIKVCAKAGPHTVFLIDEPETSLHVRWQQQLPALLSLIAREFGCSFVVATHAPIIVANARDALSDCYLAHDQTLTPILPHQRHSVEAILLDGFSTYTPDSNEINERCAVLVARAIHVVNQPGEIDTQQREQLSEALSRMTRLLKASTADPKDPGYKHDLQLIKHARAAINELFDEAANGAVA